VIGDPSRLRLISKTEGLSRIFPTLDLNIEEKPCGGSGTGHLQLLVVVYYESIKRDLKIKPIYECRCHGRLQTKRFTRLSYSGLVVELDT
jgi:hypothetical protein